MQTITTPIVTKAHASHSKQLHTTQHVDSHSIHDSVIFGMKITIGCFIPLGILIGFDRAPGSFYAYGLSCLFWPMVSCIALGAAIGGSLGFVFGAIGHASDPEPEPGVEAAPAKTAKPHRIHLSMHSHRH